MFLQFYGLKEQPFGVTPDPHFIYPSPTYSKAFNSLSRGLEAGCGFLGLIAKPGMGKTTLVFQLLKQLEQTSRTVFLFQTQCDSRELLRYLLSGLGLDAAGQDIVTMHERLNQVLARELLAGRRFVLVIDECQNLDNSALETVRLLSDFETPETKLIQIVLVGQTELAEKLSSPRLAQLRQRISMLCRLEPLTRGEIVGYIEHRLQVAGYAGTPLFTTAALESVLAHSQGIPRNINNLCFNALLAGYTAGRKQINSAIVDQVLTELEMIALEPKRAVTLQEPLKLLRTPIILETQKGPLSSEDLLNTAYGRRTQSMFGNSSGVSDRSEEVDNVTLPEPEVQLTQPQASSPPPNSPLSSAGIPGGDLSHRKQVDLGSGNLRRASTENSDLPQRLSTASVVPRKAAQSDLVAARADSSVRKQVASTSMDGIVADLATVCPAQKMVQTGRMLNPGLQATGLSYPAASGGSLRRGLESSLALGVLALVGFLWFDSRVGGSQQLQDPAAGAVARAVTVMPPPAPQSSLARRLEAQSPSASTPDRAFVQSFLTRALALKVGRIVIDPGHGGSDTGVTGPMGLMEKDLCLDVALRLGRIIEQRLPGAEVIFTRTDDTFIPLKERTDLANEKKADLFLSIHANSSPNQLDRGVETYYLNLRGGPEAMEVAARENATAHEAESDLQELVKKIARSEKIEESRKFAQDIQDSLSRHMEGTARTVKSRGVRRAPFVVLVDANMPSVLTEISFLSNPSDEQLLKKEEYRQRLAEGLYQGVLGYLQKLNSVAYNLAPRNPAATRPGLSRSSDGPPQVEQSRDRQ